MMPKNLTETAMLVRLSISQWTARKYDREVSSKAAEAYNANEKSGRYNKVLIAEEAIKKISEIVSEARDFHYKNTLPWTDDGARLLAATNYMQYTHKMRRYRSDFENEVASFIGNYDLYIQEARIHLNGMFRQKDYPTIVELPGKYEFNVAVDPLPSSADFRVAIKDSEIQALRADMEMRLYKAHNAAMKDLWDRLYKPVKHMAEKLSDPEGKFKDTLVSNVREIVDLLPRLNVMDDPTLEELRKDVENKLCGQAPETLRTAGFVRSIIATEAQQIVDLWNLIWVWGVRRNARHEYAWHNIPQNGKGENRPDNGFSVLRQPCPETRCQGRPFMRNRLDGRPDTGIQPCMGRVTYTGSDQGLFLSRDIAPCQ